MKNKKLLALLLTMTMAVSPMTGCGKKEPAVQEQTPGTESAAASESEKQTEEKEEEPQKYTYEIATYSIHPVDEPSAVELYWEERLGHEFEYTYYEAGQYSELLRLDLAAGEIPDVFTVNNRAEMQDMIDNGFAGGFSKELLKEAAPRIYAEFEANNLFDMATFDDGLMYTLTVQSPQNMYVSPTIWNTGWLEAVGFEGMPTTLEEFEEVLLKFVTEDPDGDGVADTYAFSNTSFDMFYGAFGVAQKLWLEQSDGTVAYDIMQEGAKDALAWFAKMYEAGAIDPEFITGENKGGYWAISHAFAEERIGLSGMGQFYHWFTPEAIEEYNQTIMATPSVLPEINPDLTFDFGNQPVGPDGDYGRPNNNAVGECKIVFSKEFVEDEARFKEFLRIVEIMGGYDDPKDYMISLEGLEGDRWSYDENGKVVKTDDEAKLAPEYLVASGGNGLFAFNAPLDVQKTALEERYEWADKVYAGIRVNSYVSAIQDVLPSQGEYLEELNTLFDEAKIDIITGKKPIEYYDEVVAKAYEMGYDVLEKEANEIYGK